jgi:S1-C subfamily serine protease
MPAVDPSQSPADTGPVPVTRVPPPAARPTADPTGGFDIEVDSANAYDPSINARPYLRRLEPPQTGPNWPLILKVGAFVLLIIAGIWFVARLRSGPDGEASAFGGPDGPTINPTVDQLAQATVQIIGLDQVDQPLCSGSGTFVSTDGLILTNAHVVTSDELCGFDSIGIAVTLDSGRPPDLLYRAETLAIDPELDLAVLGVSAPLDPGDPVPIVFPALDLGDSDNLGIGDDLRILGYPEIGGETITFTNGSVSGFTAQAGVGDRALIKTDATIAGGNSGGAAVDLDGRLIGIPTKARATETGPAVDCRPLADTNGDGEVDELDNCVPIGGFLNGLRPINLARDLIDEAGSVEVGPVEAERPRVEVDPALVMMSRPRFSIGQAEDNPVELVETATGGIEELCLFVDWRGIPDGAEWDGIWWYNGDIVDDYSLVGQLWEFGNEGSNFWICAIDNANGLGAGLYELGFFLNDNLVFAEGIVVTEEPTDVVATVWENGTEVDVCGLAVNPAGSGQVGLNELPVGQPIPPGDSAALRLPIGEVVVEATDCSGQPVADSAGSILIEPDRTYTIERPGPSG